MPSFIRNLWQTICSGWVVEYPSSRDGPSDLFDNRDRTPWGFKKPKYDRGF
jgi:hypothetical protein